LTISPAHALSITFENIGTADITVFNMWLRIDGSDFEILSADYGIKPPADMRYDLNITNANPLSAGETYTTPKIAALPSTGVEYFSVGFHSDSRVTQACS
jgi:hypothetical protein